MSVLSNTNVWWCSVQSPYEDKDIHYFIVCSGLQQTIRQKTRPRLMIIRRITLAADNAHTLLSSFFIQYLHYYYPKYTTIIHNDLWSIFFIARWKYDFINCKIFLFGFSEILLKSWSNGDICKIAIFYWYEMHFPDQFHSEMREEIPIESLLLSNHQLQPSSLFFRFKTSWYL